MGVYDRTYMNDGEESSGYAGRRFTAVTVMILINAVVWILWKVAESNDNLALVMVRNFLLHPELVFGEHRIHTIFTTTISHIKFMHILFNMYALYLFGKDVETVYGNRNFYWIYFFTGVFAALTSLGVTWIRTDGNWALAHPELGASGAVMGIAVIAAFLQPNRPMLLFGVIEISLKWIVLIYVGFDLLGLGEATGEADKFLTGGSRIGHAAHLGGALAGFLFYKFDLQLFSRVGRSNVGIWNSIKRIFRRKPKLRVIEREVPREMPPEMVATVDRPRHVAAGSSSSGRVDAQTSQRVDELLIKISKEGMNALTDEERTFLKESSQKYKKN